MTESIFLEIKWSVSKGRETYGYNICTLTDTSTGKRFRCTGGGYDMLGTVFGEWLQETHQAALRAIADQAYYDYSLPVDERRNEGGLYGLVSHPKSMRLDGACGIESMRRIAEAIGLHVKSVSDHRDRHIGYIVTGADES